MIWCELLRRTDCQDLVITESSPKGREVGALWGSFQQVPERLQAENLGHQTPEQGHNQGLPVCDACGHKRRNTACVYLLVT